MTKIQMHCAFPRIEAHFQLEGALDDALMSRISEAQAVYGIERIQLAKSLDRIVVEYDASRLSAADVEAVLRGRGIPVVPAGSLTGSASSRIPPDPGGAPHP